ncbi:MAG: hypothetical protein EXR86_12470 [Gammaproteobacteria bacterium]|nr:hypothetical protein [Gammaproteobacteria bacterium]
MAVYEVIDAAPDHIEQIAANMRQVDIDECWAQSGTTVREGLRTSLKLSTTARVVCVDGTPGAMFGVLDHREHGGQLWMVGTNLIATHKRACLECSRREIAEFRTVYDKLWNYIDARNVHAIRWLRWLGFTLSEPVEHGPFLKPFHLFYWFRPANAAVEVKVNDR